jgi:GNAT superfamily N-acetyltransferase
MKTTTIKQLPSYIKVVDLRLEYNHELLEYFYENTMKKFFPIEDELDPIEAWIENILPENQDKEEMFLLPDMHICIAFDTRYYEEKNSKFHRIAGATVWEYYKMSNCGLLSYFMVDERYRATGMGKCMVYQAYEMCKHVAQEYQTKVAYQNIVKQRLDYSVVSKLKGHEKLYYQKMLLASSYKTFFAFFAETNAYDVDDGVMLAPQRHEIMRKIGFRMLDCDYIQPPLSEEQEPCVDLLLLALDVAELPRDVHNREYIPTIIVEAFLLEFGYSVFEETEFLTEGYFQHMLKDLAKRGPKLHLSTESGIPWLRRTNYKEEPKKKEQQTLQSKL